MAELNQERHEVTLIQENLKKTNLDRKCWRMVGKLNLLMELFKFMLSINVVWPIQTIVIVYGDSSFKLFLGGVLAEKTVAAVLIDLGTQLAEIDEVSIMGRYL